MKAKERIKVLNESKESLMDQNSLYVDPGHSSRSIENVAIGLNTVNSMRDEVRHISPDLSYNGPSMAESIHHFVQNFSQDEAHYGDLSQTFQASRDYTNVLPPVLLKKNKVQTHPNHAFFSGTSRGLSAFKKKKEDPVKTLLEKIRREHKHLNTMNKEKKFELEQLVKQRLGDDLSHLPFMQKKNSLNIQYSKSPRSMYMLHQESLAKLAKQGSKFSFGKKSSSLLPEIDDTQKKTEVDYNSRFQRLNVDTDIEFEELNLTRMENRAPPNYFSPKRHISKTPVNIRNSIPGMNTFEIGQNRARSDTPNKMENGEEEGLQGKKKTLKIYIYDGQNSTDRMKREVTRQDSAQNVDMKFNSHYASIELESLEKDLQSIEVRNYDVEQAFEEVERKPSLKKTITSKISRKSSKSPSFQFFENFDSQSAEIQRELELSGILAQSYSHDEEPEGSISTIVQNYHGIPRKKKNIGPLLRKGRSGSSHPTQGKKRLALGYQSERPINRVIYSERKVEGGNMEDGLFSDDEIAPSPGLMESRFSPKKKKRRGK